MNKKILVVDDEKLIVKGIKFSLEQEGMTIDVAYDGEEALELTKKNDYNLILLDVMLPKIEGLLVCQMIREFSSVPIIMLSAKGEDIDKIMGLEYGADDYITKPFNILEVKARIKAILRRSIKKVEEDIEIIKIIKLKDIEINIESRRTFIKDNEVNLTAKEFDILELLMKNIGKVYSREMLLSDIWGSNTTADTRGVDVHVRRLREKIEKNPSEPQYIHTKWGVGYYFK